jgi:hypothetical protein
VSFLKVEPAAVVSVILGFLAVLVSSGVDVPDDLSGILAHGIPLIMGAVLAVTVRPVKVPVIVAGVVELFVIAGSLGIDFPGPNDAEWVAAVSTLLTALGALLIRSQATPAGVVGVVDPEVIGGVAGRRLAVTDDSGYGMIELVIGVLAIVILVVVLVNAL